VNRPGWTDWEVFMSWLTVQATRNVYEALGYEMDELTDGQLADAYDKLTPLFERALSTYTDFDKLQMKRRYFGFRRRLEQGIIGDQPDAV
jgi:hypothetical protein